MASAWYIVFCCKTEASYKSEKLDVCRDKRTS